MAKASQITSDWPGDLSHTMYSYSDDFPICSWHISQLFEPDCVTDRNAAYDIDVSRPSLSLKVTGCQYPLIGLCSDSDMDKRNKERRPVDGITDKNEACRIASQYQRVDLKTNKLQALRNE